MNVEFGEKVDETENFEITALTYYKLDMAYKIKKN